MMIQPQTIKVVTLKSDAESIGDHSSVLVKKAMNHSSKDYNIITGRQFVSTQGWVAPQSSTDPAIPEFIPNRPRGEFTQKDATDFILARANQHTLKTGSLTAKQSTRSRLANLKTQSQLRKNVQKSGTQSMRTTPIGGVVKVYTASQQQAMQGDVNEQSHLEMERRVTKYLKLDETPGKYNLANLRKKAQTSLGV